MAEFRYLSHTRNCPVELAMCLIGQRWKVRVLFALTTGVKRFGELRAALPGISDKVLTDAVRALEADGLVSRKVFAEVPARVEYELTDTGRALWDAVAPLRQWGMQYKLVETA